MYYVIADLDFCNEEKAARLQFKNSQEMNTMIIDKWNKIITDDDKVFIFGKVFHKTAKVIDMRMILESLKGKVHLGSYQKNKLVSKSIWKNLGFTGVWDCSFKDKVLIKGVKENVKFITHPNEKIEGYCCVDSDVLKEPYNDKKLCLSAEFWDFTPIAVKELGNLFDNMILFSEMEDK